MGRCHHVRGEPTGNQAVYQVERNKEGFRSNACPPAEDMGGPLPLVQRHVSPSAVAKFEGQEAIIGLAGQNQVWEAPNKPALPLKCTGFLFLVGEAGRMKDTKDGVTGQSPGCATGKYGLMWVAFPLSREVPLSGRAGPGAEIPSLCPPLVTAGKIDLLSLASVRPYSDRPSGLSTDTCVQFVKIQ